jgi:hypothetical protein
MRSTTARPRAAGTRHSYFFRLPRRHPETDSWHKRHIVRDAPSAVVFATCDCSSSIRAGHHAVNTLCRPIPRKKLLATRKSQSGRSSFRRCAGRGRLEQQPPGARPLYGDRIQRIAQATAVDRQAPTADAVVQCIAQVPPSVGQCAGQDWRARNWTGTRSPSGLAFGPQATSPAPWQFLPARCLGA